MQLRVPQSSATTISAYVSAAIRLAISGAMSIETCQLSLNYCTHEWKIHKKWFFYLSGKNMHLYSFKYEGPQLLTAHFANIRNRSLAEGKLWWFYYLAQLLRVYLTFRKSSLAKPQSPLGCQDRDKLTVWAMMWLMPWARIMLVSLLSLISLSLRRDFLSD